jgi:dipeptidase D
MNSISSLTPTSVWTYFQQICEIPRPSKSEGLIIKYLLAFGEKFGLETRQDKTGNVLIKKEATNGFDIIKPVILQSHVDMVCEKNSNVIHDFLKDSIQPFIDGDWVKAKGTTLGADNGIGMAYQLAVLASSEIKHGPIECLFTIDEETGLTGAFGLESGFLEGKILINLDSEDDGIVFIGCAGGIDTVGSFTPDYETTPGASFAFRVSVSGLKGGHSGDDIHRGLGNANKILNRYLWETSRNIDFRLAELSGGNLRNALAREAFATCVVPYAKKEEVRVLWNMFLVDIENEFKHTEPNITFNLESTDIPQQVFTASFQSRLLNTIYAMPHGVLAMSQEIKGLVETSTNLASVKMNGSDLLITTSQRSSVESSKYDAANMVESVLLLGGAEVKHSDGYPGWSPKTNSEILKISIDCYEKRYGLKPEVKAIHAGLECGLFLAKYPGLDMISIGPTIKGAHSPDERVLISSVAKYWDHLLDVLQAIPHK